jgi:hypothetical protein
MKVFDFYLQSDEAKVKCCRVYSLLVVVTFFYFVNRKTGLG